MALIADCDRRGGWKDGFGSCAEWLAWKIGITIGPARERVRAARALENLPQTADVLKGRLEPEVGAVLMRAVEAASDALFRVEGGAAHGGRDAGSRGGGAATREPGPDDPRPKPKQRWADAVGLLAERALAAGFGGGQSSATPEDGAPTGARRVSGTRCCSVGVTIAPFTRDGSRCL